MRQQTISPVWDTPKAPKPCLVIICILVIFMVRHFKTVLLELLDKLAKVGTSKVPMQDIALLQKLGIHNAKSTSVGDPCNTILDFLLPQKMMQFLGKLHAFQSFGET